MSDPVPVEYLYGVDLGISDDSRYDTGLTVVPFQVTRKTARRIYYIRSQSGHRRPDGTYPHTEIGYVDRQAIERDGEIWRRSAGWWEPDSRLYLTPPRLDRPTAATPDLSQLRAEMAAAHPDRGGTCEEFIAVRARYETGRRNTTEEQPR